LQAANKARQESDYDSSDDSDDGYVGSGGGDGSSGGGGGGDKRDDNAEAIADLKLFFMSQLSDVQAETKGLRQMVAERDAEIKTLHHQSFMAESKKKEAECAEEGIYTSKNHFLAAAMSFTNLLLYVVVSYIICIGSGFCIALLLSIMGGIAGQDSHPNQESCGEEEEKILMHAVSKKRKRSHVSKKTYRHHQEHKGELMPSKTSGGLSRDAQFTLSLVEKARLEEKTARLEERCENLKMQRDRSDVAMFFG